MLEPTRYLSPVEHAKLRSVLSSRGPSRSWFVVDLLLGTGLRASEVVRLDASDYLPQYPALRIIRSKKRQKAPELIPLSRALSEHIGAYLAGRSSGPLLCGQRGRLTTGGVLRIWREALDVTGIDLVAKACKDGRKRILRGCHCARHTFAVRLYGRSKDLRLTQKALGHSSPQTTAAFYADVPWEEWREAVDAVG